MSFFNKFRKGSGTSSGGRPSRLIPSSFENDVARQRSMEVATAVCHKSIKKYQEALSEVHRLDGRIAEMVDTLPYFKQELPSGISEEVRMAHLDALENGKQLLRDISAHTDGPLKTFAKIYPGISEAIKIHERRAQEFEKAQQKFDKMSGSADPAKLDKVERQRDVAERNWLMVNDTLPEELPKLYESRVDFFDPCLQGLLLSEMRYFRNLLTNLETLTMDCDISDKEFKEEIDQQLAQMRELSIVGT